ncbi:MAG: FtsW/RodA/SpoVE family cell cycle protein [Chloroflexota bacterium]
MGNGIVTLNGPPSRHTIWGFDVYLLLLVVSLLVFGLLMVYSASWDYSLLVYGSEARMFQRQLVWLGLALLAAIVCSRVDYHRWHRRAALVLLLVSLFLLLVVLFFGEERFGARRTLFSGSFQPSELVKLALVIYLAVWVNAKRGVLNDVGYGLIPLTFILGPACALIALQPDWSALLTVVMLGGVMFFLSGVNLKQVVIVGVGSLIIGSLVVLVLYMTGSTRITDYVSGLQDPTESSYHVLRSLGAFVRGGWLGVGFGKSEEKLTGLPVAPTDSIYAVIGEETGVVGSGALAIWYLLLMWRGLIISRQARDNLGMLLASGLTILVTWEAVINMGGVVGLLPFPGNALPFISVGGSSLVISLIAVGILMNIARQSEGMQQVEGSLSRAVVDMRGRNRRRGVSGPIRPERSEED